MITHYRMQNPYVDLRSLLFCGIVYVLQIGGSLLQIGVDHFKVAIEVLSLLATGTTIIYNAIKSYGEIIGLLTKRRKKKKDKEKVYEPPSDDYEL